MDALIELVICHLPTHRQRAAAELYEIAGDLYGKCDFADNSAFAVYSQALCLILAASIRVDAYSVIKQPADLFSDILSSSTSETGVAGGFGKDFSLDFGGIVEMTSSSSSSSSSSAAAAITSKSQRRGQENLRLAWRDARHAEELLRGLGTHRSSIATWLRGSIFYLCVYADIR
jgi:hypothetical protein